MIKTIRLKQKDGSESQNLNESKFVSFTKVFDISKNGIILFFLCVVPIVLYWRTINYEFVWDDLEHLIKNTFLNPVSFGNLLHFWKEVHWGLYIPVSYTLWGLIKELSVLIGLTPDSPVLFHSVNILLHLINGLLVFTLLRQFIKDRWYALIGTLFFLLHPIQVESVAWVAEFRGLLSFTLGFSALYQYLKGSYYKYDVHDLKLSRRYYIYGWLLFVAALLSKPSIMVVLFFGPILEYFLYRTPFKNLFVRMMPYALPVLAIIIITMSAQGEDVNRPYPFWIRPFVFSDSILFYLRKILIPINFAASYARKTEYLEEHWWFYLSLALTIGMFVIIYKNRKKWELGLLGTILFFLGLSTVSGLIKFDFQSWSNVADRYTYISMFGIAIIISSSLEQIKLIKNYIFILSIFILAGLTLITYLQIPIWKNEITLWDHAVKKTPTEYRAWMNRGTRYSILHENENAIRDFKKAIELNSNDAEPYNKIGLALCEQKKYDEALNYFSIAINLTKKNTYLINRAKTHKDMKQYPQAVKDYYTVIEMGMETQEVRDDLGNINLIVGNYELAINEFTESINLDPKNEVAYYNRGFSYMNLRKFDMAIKDYQEAIRLNHAYEPAINALDVVTKLNSIIHEKK